MGRVDGAMFRRLLLDERPVDEKGPKLNSARSGKPMHTVKLGRGPGQCNGPSARRGRLVHSASASAIGQQSARSSTAHFAVQTTWGREPADAASPTRQTLSASCAQCNAVFLPESSIFPCDSEPGRFLCRACVSGRKCADGQKQTECSKCLRFVQRFSEVHRSGSGRTAIICEDCLNTGPMRCASCGGKRVSSPFARLGNNLYHKDCLKCSLCSAWIRGEASHTPPFGLICAKCGEGVTGQSEQLEKVIFEGDDINSRAVDATPSSTPTARDTELGEPSKLVDAATGFTTHTGQEFPCSKAASATRASPGPGGEACAFEWDPGSALPTESGEVWYHLAEEGRLAVRSSRTSRGTLNQAPILRSLAPLLPGGVCSMRLKVTRDGLDAKNGEAAADLDVGLAASSVLCEHHSSSWRRRQHYAEMATNEAEGWLLLCSGPSAARSAAFAEVGGMVEAPPANSVSSKANRKVARLSKRAASWHCELHHGDVLTISVELQLHRTQKAGSVPGGTVSFFLNRVRILQADFPFHLSGLHKAEDSDGGASYDRRWPVYHVVAAVRQPGVGLTLGCDEDVRLYL